MRDLLAAALRSLTSNGSSWGVTPTSGSTGEIPQIVEQFLELHLDLR